MKEKKIKSEKVKEEKKAKYTGYVYELYPTPDDITHFNKAIGCKRVVYNHFLDMNMTSYANTGMFIYHKTGMSALLTDFKKQHDWLYEPSALIYHNALIDLEKAIRAVTESNFGFPYFLKKKDDVSVRIDQMNGHIKWTDKYIQIPKLGKVRWNYHRKMKGKFKSLTISTKNGRWYVSCLCEEPLENVPLDYSKPKLHVGIDLNKDPVVQLSSGDTYSTSRTAEENKEQRAEYDKRTARYERKQAKKRKANAKLYAAERKELKERNEANKLEKEAKKKEVVDAILAANPIDLTKTKEEIKAVKRKLSVEIGKAVNKIERPKKEVVIKTESKRAAKTKQQIARRKTHEANKQHDELHKISNDIINNHTVIGIEDLDVKGMEAKGMQRVGIGMLVNQLIYKAPRRGSKVVKVGRYFASTQLCSLCNHRQPMPLEVRTYVCSNPACGHIMDRNLNAAINVDDEVLRILHVSDKAIWDRITKSTAGIAGTSEKSENAQGEKDALSMNCKKGLGNQHPPARWGKEATFL